MTRTELIQYAKRVYNEGARDTWKVANCKAQIIETRKPGVYLLKSYSTIVGVFTESTGTLYIFDYYSATTYQHIYKAAKILVADRITWLYRKSNRDIETSLTCYANTFKATAEQYDRLEESDWAIMIADKPFRY